MIEMKSAQLGLDAVPDDFKFMRLIPRDPHALRLFVWLRILVLTWTFGLAGAFMIQFFDWDEIQQIVGREWREPLYCGMRISDCGFDFAPPRQL